MTGGMLGGLVGSWAMTRLMSWRRSAKGLSADALSPQEGKADTEGLAPFGTPRRDTTAATAKAVAELVAGEPLRRKEAEAGGVIVHYAFGAAVEAGRRAASGRRA